MASVVRSSHEPSSLSAGAPHVHLPVAVLAGFVAPLALAAVLSPLRGSVATSAAALLFVAVIASVALLGNRLAGVVASVSSALWFDFFLTAPYEQFAINHRSDIEIAVCLLVVGLIVTELSAQSRTYRWVARTEATYVDLIRSIAHDAATDDLGTVVVDRCVEALTELLHLRHCSFEYGLADFPLARIQPDGDVVHVGLRWPVRRIGLPGPQSEVIAQWRGVVVGRFVLTPTPGLPVSIERRRVAAVIADLVGATLAPRAPTDGEQPRRPKATGRGQ